MKLSIETLPAYRIAYIRKVGPYGSDNIETMERMKRWARANGLLNNESILLGIARDDPAATSPKDCRYDTCVVVPTDFLINSDGIGQARMESGQYAVFTIEHTAEGVQKAWCEIFPELEKQGCSCDETRPVLERYQAKLVKEHFCEICVPIRERRIKTMR